MMRIGTLVAAALLVGSWVPAKAFDGPYFGLDLGYARGDAESRLEVEGLGATAAVIDHDGFELGLFGGWRMRMPNDFVIGGEVGGIYSRARGSRFIEALPPPFEDVEFEGEARKNREFYLSVKPGFMLQPDTMVYLIGGLQRSRFDVRTPEDDGTWVSLDRFDLNGWHVGVGTEVGMMQNLSFRAEYKYQDYRTRTLFDEAGERVRFTADEHVLRLGVVYRF